MIITYKQNKDNDKAYLIISDKNNYKSKNDTKVKSIGNAFLELQLSTMWFTLTDMLKSQGGHTSSAHSSTGPSNNTGSTGLSGAQWPQGFPPGARPPHFPTGAHRGPHHFPTPPRATGTPVQYPTAPGTPQFGPGGGGGGQGAQIGGPQFPPHAQFGGPVAHYQGGGHYPGD